MPAKLNNNKTGGFDSARRRQERKREEAEERQDAHDKRSKTEQLALMEDRRGLSRKETAKLLQRSRRIVIHV